MKPSKEEKLAHFEWAIKSRTDNQTCAVRLLRLFLEHEDQWKTKKWAFAAQELLSVSFSLWRAAFLADKTAKRSAVFSHGLEFLEKIIEDNAISFGQDRKCNEWTFNYYTRNARAALESLHRKWPSQVGAYHVEKLTPTKRWRYCQGLLDAAVVNFEALAKELKSKVTLKAEARVRRSFVKAKKRRSREVTLAAREAGNRIQADA